MTPKEGTVTVSQTFAPSFLFNYITLSFIVFIPTPGILIVSMVPPYPPVYGERLRKTGVKVTVRTPPRLASRLGIPSDR